MENVKITEKKTDVTELAKALSKLPEEERLKIYYIIKGIELVNEQLEAETKAVG